jgi:hypothetical protein
MRLADYVTSGTSASMSARSGCQRRATAKFSNSALEERRRRNARFRLPRDSGSFQGRGTLGDSHSCPRLTRYGNRRMRSPRLHSLRRRTVVWLHGDRQSTEDNLSPAPNRLFPVKRRTVARLSLPTADRSAYISGFHAGSKYLSCRLWNAGMVPSRMSTMAWLILGFSMAPERYCMV